MCGFSPGVLYTYYTYCVSVSVLYCDTHVFWHVCDRVCVCVDMLCVRFCWPEYCQEISRYVLPACVATWYTLFYRIYSYIVCVRCFSRSPSVRSLIKRLCYMVNYSTYGIFVEEGCFPCGGLCFVCTCSLLPSDVMQNHITHNDVFRIRFDVRYAICLLLCTNIIIIIFACSVFGVYVVVSSLINFGIFLYFCNIDRWWNKRCSVFLMPIYAAATWQAYLQCRTFLAKY